MLKGSALRAARVVIDIGWHLDLPLPAVEAKRHGERWNFDVALEVLENRGRIADAPGLPGDRPLRGLAGPGDLLQARRARLDRRPRRGAGRGRGADFDLKAWHTRALNLGPIGLDNLASVLRG